MIAGAALGGAAIEGLHAQAKLKAYSVGEIEVTDASAQPGYLPAVRNAIEKAHGRTLRTLNGRVVSIEGGAPPKNVAIIGSGTVWRTQWRFISQKPGQTWRPSVTNRKRRYGGT